MLLCARNGVIPSMEAHVCLPQYKKAVAMTKWSSTVLWALVTTGKITVIDEQTLGLAIQAVMALLFLDY